MSKRFVLSVLTVFTAVGGVVAEEVSTSEAVYAAKRWALSGAVPGGPLGQSSRASVKTLAVTNGVSLHVVRLDAGTAFVSTDTRLEPIVAYTTATNFTADADNRLWRLLQRDAEVRAAVLGLLKDPSRMASAPAAFVEQVTASSTASEGKWAALLEGSSRQSIMRFGAAVPNKLNAISDVRCAPLLKSKWSQTSAQGHDCYNYYTPDHDPCGCTATAMAQIMRYHEYPKGSVEAKTYPCEVNGQATDLTMQGGTYDWAKMTLCPNTATYVEANWKAIGKLTSDVGIALQSSYTSGAGSSYVSLVGKALKDAFGYANAAAIFNWDIAKGAYQGDGRVHVAAGLHKLAVREKVIYANLDAKCPVELGVYGYGDEEIGTAAYWEGHAIVADGYGYSEYGGEQVPYVHINLGWHGLDDAWYNIPEIHSPNSGSYVGSEGTAFTVLSAAAYNLFPTAKGNIVSGRVYDDEGKAVVGARMTIRESGSSVAIAEKETDEAGIYAFIVPGAKSYDITCLLPAYNMQDTHAVTVPKETLEVDDPALGIYTEKDANVGNYWGHDADFEMACPCVSNLTQGTTFSKLHRALEAVADGDVLALLQPAPLLKSLTLKNSITLFATNVDAAAALVTRVDGAALTVENATLTLSNIVFSASDATLLTVKAGGNVTLQAGVDLGMSMGQIAISTEDADGFTLAGPLDGGSILFHCATAINEPSQFGTYVCDAAVAEESAKKIVCADDENRETRGLASDGLLTWKVTDVPVSDAGGYFVDASGATNAYARLDRVFEKFALASEAGLIGPAPEIVIRDVPGLKLSRSLAVTSKLTVRGEGAPLVSVVSGDAGFVVSGQGDLTIEGVVFDGYVGPGLVVVNGTDAELKVRRTVFRNILGTDVRSGALAVLSGSVTVSDGCVFENCRVEDDDYHLSHKSAYGGAIFLEGAGSRVSLFDSTITNCWASTAGGGVYVGRGARLGIGGDLRIMDNKAGYNYACKANNICVYDSTAILVLEKPFSGANGIVGVNYYYTSGSQGFGNAPGNRFVTLSDAVTDPVAIRNTCASFFSDLYPQALFAEHDEARAALRWTEELDTHVKTGGEADAFVRVVNGGADANGYYYRLEDAAEALGGSATLVVLKDGTFANDVTIGTDVILTGIVSRTVTRIGDVSVKVTKAGTLQVGETVFDGGNGRACFFDVVGGELTLSRGARICNARGGGSWSANAVTVKAGGQFVLEDGAAIVGCGNACSEDADGESGRGGGLSLEASTACLRGGAISGCYAEVGGGVYAGGTSTVYVSGNVRIAGNRAATAFASESGGTWNDLVVSEDSFLVLNDKLDGSVGYTEGVGGDANVFGRVDAVVTTAVADSATNFWHNLTEARGVVATNGTDALLVWTTAVKTDESGSYYEDAEGNRYEVVTRLGPVPPPGPTPEPVVTNYPAPIAFQSIERLSESTWRLVVTNRVPWCRYWLVRSDDLSKDFVTTDACEQATGDAPAAWTNDVEAVGGQFFWKAGATWGIVPSVR